MGKKYEHNSFILYKDSRTMIDRLSTDQQGKLLSAIFAYACDGTLYDFGGDMLLQMCFDVIRAYLDRDEEKYQQRCDTNRENVEKRWKKSGKKSLSKSNTSEYDRIRKIQTYTNYTDNDNDSDNDSDRGKDREPQKVTPSKGAKRFAPPTLDDVMRYCREMGYSIDVQRFIDFYTSKGWYVGKNKMKDWKAAVRNWVRQDKQAAGGPSVTGAKKNSFHNFTQRDTDYDALVEGLVFDGMMDKEDR